MKPCVHRLAIAQLAENEEKASKISSRLKVPLRTVQKIVKQWKSDGNVDTKRKSGRPPSVNTRRIHAIIKKRVTRNDGVSLNSIAKSLDISCQSVQSIVKNSLGLHNYRLYRGQHLSDDAKLKRLTRCKKLLQIFLTINISPIPKPSHSITLQRKEKMLLSYQLIRLISTKFAGDNKKLSMEQLKKKKDQDFCIFMEQSNR